MTMKIGSPGAALLSALMLVLLSNPAPGEPFKLGIEEKGYLQDVDSGQYQYPAPKAVPTQPPLKGNVQQEHKKKPAKLLKGNAEERLPTPRPPMNLGVQQQRSIPLPPQFLGAWMVYGTRQNVDALPQYQEGVFNIFAQQTEDMWNISGDPNSGYAFTNAGLGVSSAIYVDKVSGDTAFIRYQHPIKNTMAQEAIVMQLVPGGAQFNGLERISIVKPGEKGQPRAKVTYQLMGRRQR